MEEEKDVDKLGFNEEVEGVEVIEDNKRTN